MVTCPQSPLFYCKRIPKPNAILYLIPHKADFAGPQKFVLGDISRAKKVKLMSRMRVDACQDESLSLLG